MPAAFHDVFRARRVLVTGDTGFKGGWLAAWLTALGARVFGLALEPPSTPSFWMLTDLAPRLTHHLHGDIGDAALVCKAMEAARPEVVFHLAAQALVRPSYQAPVRTFSTNVLGTAHVLEAVRTAARPCVVIVVTSDKCYAPDATRQPYDESAPLGGSDPYSASKAAAEIIAASYRDAFFHAVESGVRVATVRAGNVIGGGDYATDRLVPDIVRAIVAKEPVSMRNPQSVRPWQHVLEPLSGYLWLAARLLTDAAPTLASAWNFGPDVSRITVRELVACILAAWGSGRAIESAPALDAPAEAGRLQLLCTKAHRELPWRPVLTLDETARATVAWYRAAAAGADADALWALTGEQIEAYLASAQRAGEAWATETA